MVDATDDEGTRRRALAGFGPQFDIPAGVTVDAVYVQVSGAGPAGVALAVPPVTGPGWFYFDADSRRLLPYAASPVAGVDLLTCPACREHEPAPTTQEIDGSPEIIARPCSTCGVDLWWNAGLWRRL